MIEIHCSGSSEVVRRCKEEASWDRGKLQTFRWEDPQGKMGGLQLLKYKSCIELWNWTIIHVWNIYLHNIIDKPILYKRTRTIIVNPINWLQVLQHASGRELYLTVGYKSYWRISSTINGKGGRITSASAGTVSPASPSNSVSKRLGQTNWQYADDAGKWFDGDIRVVSIPRT